jgi:hypothetical protein
MAFCTNCGNQISDLAVACPKCGTPNALRPQPRGGPALERTFSQAPQLRPLGIGEIIDVSIKLYRNHAGTLLKAVAVVVVPVQILSALILTSAIPDTPDPLAPVPPGGLQQPDPTAAFDGSALWAFFAGILVTVVLGGIATQLATAASLRAVSEGYLGERPTWRESLAFAFERIGSLIWLALLSGFLILLGTLACIVPGIYLTVAWSVAVPVLLFEGTVGWGALRRSMDLVKGRFWSVAGVLVLGRLIAGVLGFIFGIAFTFVQFGSDSPVVVFFASAIANAISQTLTTPFLAATITIMYFDLRVRKEGFDLELLAQQVGAPPGEAPPAAASWAPDPAPRPPRKPTSSKRKPTASKAKPTAAKPKPAKRKPPASRRSFEDIEPEEEEDATPEPPVPKPKRPAPRRRPVRPGYVPPTDEEPTDGP